MPTITVPDAVYQRLAARAAAAGTTVEALAVPALEYAAEVPPAETPNDVPFVVWKQNYDAMTELFRTTMASKLPPGFVLDDSRESIYEGCGE